MSNERKKQEQGSLEEAATGFTDGVEDPDATVIASFDSSETVDNGETQIRSTEQETREAAPSQLVDPVLGVPRVMGNLELFEKLGEGGMAAVYRARNQDLEVERAVKVLSPERAKEKEFMDRFHREAIMSAHLTHPNVVQVYNVGEEKGFHFIEMELVSGKTLAQLMEEVKKGRAEDPGNLPIQVAVAIISNIAEALDLAHTCKVHFQGQEWEGIVHRDLKPDNIMITDEGVCKLMDLGIARPIDVTQTVVGTIQGTFAYMSPEQWSGNPDEIDNRTDLFSLGIVLYEICTGERPFQGKSITTISEAAKHGKFMPPVKLNPDVFPEVDKIINKALKADPKQRYQSAKEMLNDLRKILMDFKVVDTNRLIRSYLTGEIILPGPKPSPPKKRPVIWVAAAVVLIAIGGWVADHFTHFISSPEPVKVTISANYGPVEVYWNDVKVTTPARAGDLQNFIVENVEWGSHNRVRVVLLKTNQEQEIPVEIEQENPVIRVNF